LDYFWSIFGIFLVHFWYIFWYIFRPHWHAGGSVDGVTCLLRDLPISASEYAFGRTKIFIRTSKTVAEPRVSRWFLFKLKIPIWGNFGRPTGRCYYDHKFLRF
jgi:hypothetical protein